MPILSNVVLRHLHGLLMGKGDGGGKGAAAPDLRRELAVARDFFFLARWHFDSRRTV